MMVVGLQYTSLYQYSLLYALVYITYSRIIIIRLNRIFINQKYLSNKAMGSIFTLF